MFADLLDIDIQPKDIDARNIPEIEVSENVRMQLQQLLIEEEENYVKVSNMTTIVQIDKNYVFFSNQWLYLAVICKKYAEALYPYCDFFDKKIKSNQDIINSLSTQKYSDIKFMELFADEIDKERMIKFIEADSEFRPGKALLNGNKTRSTKDIFGSCILKKIAVPDSSSNYLGNLIYYLAKRQNLFDALEVEVKNQMGNADNVVKLSSVVKDCAKEIIDYIYELDKFEKINSLFENMDKNIKVNTSRMKDVLPNGNFLRYVFARPTSDMYDPEGSDKPRVFADKDYDVTFDGENFSCRLTTEWVGSEIELGGTGNYLNALILIVNKYYEGQIEIKTEADARYLYLYKNNFNLKNLPDIFGSDFAKRYITSLLAKPFVILTGNSGTGKTRIAKQFAEYLEKKTEEGRKNWAIIPVGADWTDNVKMLGFFNPLANEGKGDYVKTGIVELIEQANIHRNVPYFLILDEMNLSHVERYFSDFLSHMETPDSAFELDGYEGVLKFPENLFVVGTVNIDETTYMFSPKVLDRANVVEFKPQKDEVLKLFINPANNGKVCSANDGSAEAFLKLAKEIRAGKCDEEINMESVKKVFDFIYEVAEKQGFEFAYRTVKEIRQYISAAHEIAEKDQKFNLTQAMDEQLLQKVLPKIHGNKKEIGELLDELEKICSENLMMLSEMKIKQMKGKLAKIQYASFI